VLGHISRDDTQKELQYIKIILWGGKVMQICQRYMRLLQVTGVVALSRPWQWRWRDLDKMRGYNLLEIVDRSMIYSSRRFQDSSLD
jgi:hypothetical protein